MNDIQRCAGFNLTASKLQFVEIEKDSKNLQVVNIGQTFFSPHINYEEQDETIIGSQLQSAFDEIRIRNPITSTIASFVLPPELFITIQLPYDSNLNQKEIREEFNWEISQLFPYIAIEDLAIKFYELDGSFLPGRNNALIVALNKKYLLLIKNFCQKNNLSPKLVDSASITANSFINNHSSANQKTVTFNLFTSKNSITLFINISNKPAYVKVFDMQNGDFLKKLLQELLREDFNTIIDHPDKKTFISGENIKEDLITELEKKTQIKFEIFDPFEIVKFKAGFQNYSISAEDYSSFTSATGIATRFS